MKKPAPSKLPTVTVDPRLKATYDALVTAITSASKHEAADFDRRWEAAGRIVEHEPPLYVFGGFATPDAFYRAVMQEEPRNARRYVRVAKYASAAEEATYGTSKLDAALGFLEAKLGQPLAHPPLPVAFDRLRVPVAKGTKSLAQATVPEIAAATAKLTSAGRKKAKTPAQSALTASLAKSAVLKDVRVHERAGLVSFVGVPLASIEHFARAIAGTKLPDATARRTKAVTKKR